jgi:DNA replication protein DnaC
VSVVKSIRSWLAPEDRVLNNLAENSSHFAHEREELTCLWMGPYLTRFLKSQNHTLSFSGKPGSGKTVLASVIVDRLQNQVGGTTYTSLFVPISKP